MLPPEAVDEIMEQLSSNLKISADEIAEILEKHGVSGDAGALQSSYRKRLGQRLMASIRDETGKREVFASNNGETQTAAQRSGCGLERRSKGARAVFARGGNGAERTLRRRAAMIHSSSVRSSGAFRAV